MRFYVSRTHDSSLWFPILLWTMGGLGILVGVAVGVYLLRKYRESKWGVCKSVRRMDGKIVIITGANSGIGKETTRNLAARGAIVIMACRNREAAVEALRDIRTSTGDGDLIVMDLDLEDLESIRRFCRNFLEKFQHLDVLVNNAGVFVPPEERRTTKEGFEINMGVNHFGHFLLTHLLMDRITQTPNSRSSNIGYLFYYCPKLYDNLDDSPGWSAFTKLSHQIVYC
ncbi:unnamed protein product, partial [Meganyctiphanes norvegica]